MDKYLIRLEAPQVPPSDPSMMAQGLTAQLAHFLFPLLVDLDRLLDKRLVRTFLQSIAVILAFRDRATGLLLSELGGYLLSAEQGSAPYLRSRRGLRLLARTAVSLLLALRAALAQRLPTPRCRGQSPTHLEECAGQTRLVAALGVGCTTSPLGHRHCAGAHGRPPGPS
jgi:hypothetical protein